MNSVPLFLNPTARSAKSMRLRHWLAGREGEFEIVEPNSAEHMQESLRECARQGIETVAVAGGDGTLRLAAGALVGSETRLVVIPSGTVNVFAREIGIGSGNFNRAILAYQQGLVREIDVFSVNGDPFLQMAGIGIDGRAVELTTSEAKKKWGAIAYGVAGLRAACERQPRLRITLGDGTVEEGIAAVMGNGARYGGPWTMFGEADNSDGLLDLIIFKRHMGTIIKDCLHAALIGGFNSRMEGDFSYHKVSACSISPCASQPSSASPAAYELDGDFGGHGSISIEKLPGTLKVFVPTSSSNK